MKYPFVQGYFPPPVASIFDFQLAFLLFVFYMAANYLGIYYWICVQLEPLCEGRARQLDPSAAKTSRKIVFSIATLKPNSLEIVLTLHRSIIQKKRGTAVYMTLCDCSTPHFLVRITHTQHFPTLLYTH